MVPGHNQSAVSGSATCRLRWQRREKGSRTFAECVVRLGFEPAYFWLPKISGSFSDWAHHDPLTVAFCSSMVNSPPPKRFNVSTLPMTANHLRFDSCNRDLLTLQHSSNERATYVWPCGIIPSATCQRPWRFGFRR